MAETKIEWATYTFNPWLGCSKVSPACAHCYAEAWAKRSGLVQWGDQAERRRTSESYWREPVKWNRKASRDRVRRRVFCASLADVFEDRPELTPWRADLLQLIYMTPHLDWLLLTKRPENWSRLIDEACEFACGADTWQSLWTQGEAPENVWVGTTVENQECADKRIPELLKIPAAVRFLSVEPLLGPIDLFEWIAHSHSSTWKPPIDWVIVGGESGPNARPMHPQWARSLRDQCQAAGVAFHFKQWGEWAPGGPIEEDPSFAGGAVFLDPRGGRSSIAMIEHQPSRYRRLDDETVIVRAGKKKAGRELDGREWNEFPQSDPLMARCRPALDKLDDEAALAAMEAGNV